MADSLNICTCLKLISEIDSVLRKVKGNIMYSNVHHINVCRKLLNYSANSVCNFTQPFTCRVFKKIFSIKCFSFSGYICMIQKQFDSEE